MFKVEMLFAYGWDDAGWTRDDKPWRFRSRAAAQREINNHVRLCQDAVRRGDMAAAYKKQDFRVVRC